ncbi:MAG: hypothetical protein QGH60_16190 [Phycisphaerae bacterium]|jgi:hypothetical protein|nr:hypothetical protein [Phycisphaerae bacterium]
MKTHATQEYRDLEKLGFLCRWALLALAATVILAATWAGLSGTMTVSSNLETTMILPDAVWRQGTPTPSLYGFLDGRPARNSLTPLMFYQDHFRDLRFPWIHPERNEMVMGLPAPPAGTHRVILRGLPYGLMAFEQHQATLRIVPGPMTVYLLDARFLADVMRDDKRDKKQNAIRIAKEFSRLGQPVLVFPGQRESAQDLSDELDQYSDMPRVFSLRKGQSDLRGIIASITGRLRSREKTYKGDKRKPYVITSDVDLAISTAGQKHYTHLVGAKNPPANLPELIRLHATPEELAEHLAKEYPAHLSIP